MPFVNTLQLQESGPGWLVCDHLAYQGKRDRLVVKRGTYTDGASVPKLLRLILPALDPHWTKAAVFHDDNCYELKNAHEGHRAPRISSVDADGLFRRMARELGTPLVARWLLWTGVRLGALANPARRAGSLRTAPLVAILSILFAPIVLGVVLCPPVGLLLYGLAEAVCTGASKIYHLAHRLYLRSLLFLLV